MTEREKGFTLVELLVVMAIIGILATISLANFKTSQIKSRDVKRKADLEQVQRALETYYNDFGKYPNSSAAGLIINFAWGNAFTDPANATTIYMKQLPTDPGGTNTYCYSSVGSGTGYQLYAVLENVNDPKCLGGNCQAFTSCGGKNVYNYGVASSNTSP